MNYIVKNEGQRAKQFKWLYQQLFSTNNKLKSKICRQIFEIAENQYDFNSKKNKIDLIVESGLLVKYNSIRDFFGRYFQECDKNLMDKQGLNLHFRCCSSCIREDKAIFYNKYDWNVTCACHISRINYQYDKFDKMEKAPILEKFTVQDAIHKVTCVGFDITIEDIRPLEVIALCNYLHNTFHQRLAVVEPLFLDDDENRELKVLFVITNDNKYKVEGETYNARDKRFENKNNNSCCPMI